MKICFALLHLTNRGTDTAIYDYAKYSEEILGHTSIIAMLDPDIDQKNEFNTFSFIKFSKRFKVILYSSIEDIEQMDFDMIYTLKYGTDDSFYSKKIKTIVHCVFDMSQPHGHVYAGVSETLAKKYGKNLFVPHMISLKPGNPHDNLRDELGIPKNAIVFGRYGGSDTFSVDHVRSVITRVINEDFNKTKYFLFSNTQKFIDHPRIFFLQELKTDKDKNKFLNTLDAFIEASIIGHTFGIACGEASINKIPIIVFDVPDIWNRAHLDILGDNCLRFNYSPESFYNILVSFNPKKYKNIETNYKLYTPEYVMDKFNKVFITNQIQT